jgi:hypothetical protein
MIVNPNERNGDNFNYVLSETRLIFKKNNMNMGKLKSVTRDNYIKIYGWLLILLISFMSLYKIPVSTGSETKLNDTPVVI